MNLEIDFDAAIWDKQPLFIRGLGKSSKLYRFFSAIFNLLEDEYLSIDKNNRSFGFLARQLFISTATGRFLDEHGELYGLRRKHGEVDNDYRDRIEKQIKVFFQELPSTEKVKEYIKDETGFVIDIQELGFGYVNPDDAENPEHLILSMYGDTSMLKLIYYKLRPDLDPGLDPDPSSLSQAIEDITSPFVKYYLIEDIGGN